MDDEVVISSAKTCFLNVFITRDIIFLFIRFIIEHHIHQFIQNTVLIYEIWSLKCSNGIRGMLLMGIYYIYGMRWCLFKSNPAWRG